LKKVISILFLAAFLATTIVACGGTTPAIPADDDRTEAERLFIELLRRQQEFLQQGEQP